MQEPYAEGLANHSDRESCAGTREGAREALTGACAGWVLSLEKLILEQSADAVIMGGRQHHEVSLCEIQGTLRGRRPQACTETSAREPGEPTLDPA